MAKSQEKITQIKEGDKKGFKGAGIEGTKGVESRDSEASLDTPPDSDGEDSKVSDADKQAAEEVEFKAQGERDMLKGFKGRLKKITAENERLLKEENERGFMDGVLVTGRKARVVAIEKIKAEIKSLGK